MLFVVCIAAGISVAGVIAFLAVPGSSQSVRSSSQSEFNYTIEGDPFADLVLDQDLYGTETVEERQQMEDCYEEKTGVTSPSQLDVVTYDDAYAWRTCAEQLGLESKFIRFTPADTEDVDLRDDWVEALNRRVEIEAECLRSRGWELEAVTVDEDGVKGYRPVSVESINAEAFAVDVEECHQHAHDEAPTDHDHDHE